MTIRRAPPPPPVVADPAMNRWLHDLTSFISTSGGVDAGTIDGFSTLQTTVSNHTSEISSLQSQINAVSSTVTTHTTQISALNTLTTTHTSQIAALNAQGLVYFGSGAPASGLGKQGDLYLNLSGTAGSLLYGKTSPSAWAAIA